LMLPCRFFSGVELGWAGAAGLACASTIGRSCIAAGMATSPTATAAGGIAGAGAFDALFAIGVVCGGGGCPAAGASGRSLVASAADCEVGNLAGFELLWVEEFAAMTTSRTTVEAPRTPGNQFINATDQISR